MGFTLFTGLCFHVSEHLEETTTGSAANRNLQLAPGDCSSPSDLVFQLFIKTQGIYCILNTIKVYFLKNCPHVNENVSLLERNGSVVGGVRCHDALSVSHFVAGIVQLTHLPEAAKQRGEQNVRHNEEKELTA